MEDDDTSNSEISPNLLWSKSQDLRDLYEFFSFCNMLEHYQYVFTLFKIKTSVRSFYLEITWNLSKILSTYFCFIQNWEICEMLLFIFLIVISAKLELGILLYVLWKMLKQVFLMVQIILIKISGPVRFCCFFNCY